MHGGEPTTAPELNSSEVQFHGGKASLDKPAKMSELDRLFKALNYQEDLILTLKLRLNPVSNRLPEDPQDKVEPTGHIVDAVSIVERNNSILNGLVEQLIV